MQSFRREPAQRVFAQEFMESNLTFKESDDEFAPRFLLTPTGAKCNRVFVVGTMTECEDIGIESPYWRARVADPTGVFFIYSGQYQPRATQILSEIEIDIESPPIVAVVGKPNVYETDESTITSIRPEDIQTVDREAMESWIIDCAKQTLERIGEVETSEKEDFLRAKEHYLTEPEYYREVVYAALKTLEDGSEFEVVDVF